jgi:hypothetical protein
LVRHELGLHATSEVERGFGRRARLQG